MTALQWQLPDAPLRSNVARAIAVGAVGTVGLAVAAGSWIGARPIHPMKALGLFAIMSTVVVGFVGASHPFPRLGPANHVTLLRLVLVAVVAGLIGETPSARVAWFAVSATIAMALLDGLDGWLARRSRMVSRFGARFDMETDAMLILVLSVLVWQHGKAGVWVMACGMMRYAFVASGWLWPWVAGPLRSTRRGKTVAIGQLAGLGLALSPIVVPPYSDTIAAVTLAALTWSFAIDVRWLFHQSRLSAAPWRSDSSS